MTKPVLDADGMAEHLTTVSQADWPQLIELWRLQQYAAGHRDAEDARKRANDEQRQFAAGREAGVRETEERLAPVATDYYDESDQPVEDEGIVLSRVSAPCKHEWRQYMVAVGKSASNDGFFCIHCTERKD